MNKSYSKNNRNNNITLLENVGVVTYGHQSLFTTYCCPVICILLCV